MREKNRRWWEESSRGSCDKVSMNKAQDGSIRHGLTIHETKVQELRRLLDRQKRKLAKDLPLAARGQLTGCGGGTCNKRTARALPNRRKCFVTEEGGKVGHGVENKGGERSWARSRFCKKQIQEFDRTEEDGQLVKASMEVNCGGNLRVELRGPMMEPIMTDHTSNRF